MTESGFGKLFLIPNFLSSDNPDDFIAGMVKRLVHHIRNFIVENEKQARQLIRHLKLAHPQSDLKIWLLNEHTQKAEISNLLQALENEDAGIISDAGLPCVADPGADLVALAHSKGIEVIPLPGASSLMLTLMASGFNGQQFTFNGYLPIEKPVRLKKLKELETLGNKGITQIFMETPYRNRQMLDDLITACQGQTLLTIGCAVSSAGGWVKTLKIDQWKKESPDIHKLPAIFILGRNN